MLTLLLGMFMCFACAFLFACLDPVWGQRTSIKDAISAIIDKD